MTCLAHTNGTSMSEFYVWIEDFEDVANAANSANVISGGCLDRDSESESPQAVNQPFA